MSPLIRKTLLLVGPMMLMGCAGHPTNANPHPHLKLETIQRPFGPTTYLYRDADSWSPNPHQEVQ